MKRVLLILIGLTMFFSSCRWSSVPWWTDSQSDKGEKIFRYDRLVDEFVSLNSFKEKKYSVMTVWLMNSFP